MASGNLLRHVVVAMLNVHVGQRGDLSEVLAMLWLLLLMPLLGFLMLCIVVRHMSHNVKKGSRAMSLIKGLRTMGHNVMSLIKGLRTMRMTDNERYCRICMKEQKQQ